MVCCALITGLIAGLIWIYRRLMPGMAASPLSWRLGEADETALETHAAGFSFGARAKSFGYAFAGLKRVIRTEHNAWIHIAAAGTVVGLGVYLKISPNDWTWLILAIGWVWTAEVINTAIEQVCDAVSPDFNPAIGAAKDIAAGAVLISAVGAALIGIIRLAPYVLATDAPAAFVIPWCSAI